MNNPDIVYVTLGNTTLRTSLHEKHVDNFISNNIYDRNIKKHVCRFIGKTNTFLCDFGCWDSSTLVNILRTFYMAVNYSPCGMHFFGIYRRNAYHMANSYAKDLEITSSYS